MQINACWFMIMRNLEDDTPQEETPTHYPLTFPASPLSRSEVPYHPTLFEDIAPLSLFWSYYPYLLSIILPPFLLPQSYVPINPPLQHNHPIITILLIILPYPLLHSLLPITTITLTLWFVHFTHCLTSVRIATFSLTHYLIIVESLCCSLPNPLFHH